MSNPATTSDYLTGQQVEGEFGIPEPTLRRWRFHGSGPAYHQLGRRILYARRDVEAWIAARRVDPSGQAAAS